MTHKVNNTKHSFSAGRKLEDENCKKKLQDKKQINVAPLNLRTKSNKKNNLEYDFGKQTHELECEQQDYEPSEKVHAIELEKTHETNIFDNSNPLLV